jgi:hypothetical protein
MDPALYEPYWSDYLAQFNLPATAFQAIPAKTDRYCVIVEPRSHPLLGPVLRNFMALLQHKGWGLIIFHGLENEAFAREQVARWPNVIFQSLGVSNLAVMEYSALCRSVDFWSRLRALGCKHALIFQTDALLFRDNVDEYLQYDYVGAAWPDKWGGNGGLSLRSVDKMLEILEKYKDNNMRVPEDVYFCRGCAYFGHLAPNTVAAQFSVESITDGVIHPTGTHKPLISREQLRQYCSVRHFLPPK